ncbi:two component transcriptional regulator, LuxR family [Paracoccus halophilus]|uniref:LuxR family transcriptional regulator n=2 Tax=Paracoccus halophilus TaxID=376733 RepID=A0A099F763_9RHOB|nr:LuxR family transcriptional regulator [Paracoccus halophilus]SFA53809.1 two component transcriptional regulator, LuxR family [Paracoccus halophilus]
MNDVPFTVFVVDDDDGIRVSLERALSMRGYRVETYDSARSFLESLGGDRPGCLVLDYGMPGMNGLELQQYLNAHEIRLPIIFITGHGGVPESVQAIKGGALDFLEKPFPQSALAERIDAAFEIIRSQISADRSQREKQARLDSLTAREREIVRLFVERPAETSSKEVAAHFGISPRTVDHHRARILEKLEVKSLAELIALVRPADIAR